MVFNGSTSLPLNDDATLEAAVIVCNLSIILIRHKEIRIANRIVIMTFYFDAWFMQNHHIKSEEGRYEFEDEECFFP